MRVIRRYLLPPILNTMQSPTMLALANEAFTSPQDCHETDLLLTCVYHARRGPSAPCWSGVAQTCFRRALEMTRIRRPRIGVRPYRSSQITNSQEESSRQANHLPSAAMEPTFKALSIT